MNISLFATEPAETGVEAGPGLFAAGEQPEPLHRDVERFAVGPCTARGSWAQTPHIASRQIGLEVSRNIAEVVVDQRPLQEVEAIGVLAVESFEPPEHTFV